MRHRRHRLPRQQQQSDQAHHTTDRAGGRERKRRRRGERATPAPSNGELQIFACFCSALAVIPSRKTHVFVSDETTTFLCRFSNSKFLSVRRRLATARQPGRPSAPEIFRGFASSELDNRFRSVRHDSRCVIDDTDCHASNSNRTRPFRLHSAEAAHGAPGSRPSASSRTLRH